MKFLTVACLAIVSVVMLQGASADCDFPGAPRPLKNGETYNPIGTCITLKCEGGGFSGLGCGMMQPRSGCRLSGEDTTKPYPDCCPREMC